ncbi:MAG: type II toxin-antitoxin system VapC family toxin [Syntrophales bacterium]
MKPTVYIETSIPSYLTARLSNDLRVAANQNTTIEWWEARRPSFELFISEFVTAEAILGDSAAAQKRLETIADLPKLSVTDAVRTLAKALISENAIPPKAEVDAYHIAVAAVNGVEYLLTWNCVHIANALMRPKIEEVCRRQGFEPPIICTPQELMED